MSGYGYHTLIVSRPKAKELYLRMISQIALTDEVLESKLEEAAKSHLYNVVIDESFCSKDDERMLEVIVDTYLK